MGKTKGDKGATGMKAEAAAKAEGTAKAEGAAKPADPNEARGAFQALLARYQGLAPGEVRAANTDVTGAVAKALAAATTLGSLRARIVDELPRFDVASLDELRLRALGAWHCWLQRDAGGGRGPTLKPLMDLATPLRAKLQRAANALADYNRLDPDTVQDIERVQGTRTQDLANDLVRLHALFTEAWPRIRALTAVTEADLTSAQTLGVQLLTAIGGRAVDVPAAPDASHPATWVDASFTLFSDAYDQCRRAVAYLRWAEGDVDSLLPSLWAQAGAGRPAKADVEPPPDAPDAADPTKKTPG